MAVIDFNNVHTQAELRDVAITAFENENDLFTKGIVPDMTSQTNTALYRIFEKEYWMSSQVKTRTEATATPKATYGTVTDTFTISQASLGHDITPERIANSSASVLDPFRDGTKFLASNFLKWHQEKFVASLMNTTAATTPWAFSATGQALAVTPGGGMDNFSAAPNDTFATSNFRQFDQAASDVIAILTEMMDHIEKNTGLVPNKLLIPKDVFRKIQANATVKAAVANTIGLLGGVDQTKAILSQNLGIPIENIQIVKAVHYDGATIARTDRTLVDLQNGLSGETSDLTLDGTMDWLAKKDLLFMYSGEAMGQYTKTAASRFLWTGLTSAMKDIADAASAPSGEGADLGNFFMHAYKSKIAMAYTIDGFISLDYKVVAPELAFILKGAIA